MLILIAAAVGLLGRDGLSRPRVKGEFAGAGAGLRFTYWITAKAAPPRIRTTASTISTIAHTGNPKRILDSSRATAGAFGTGTDPSAAPSGTTPASLTITVSTRSAVLPVRSVEVSVN